MSGFIHARVYPGKDDDLIAWLESLPPGERSALIREALRVGIGLLPPPRPEGEVIAHIVREAVVEALAGLQVVAAQQGVTLDTNEVEEAFGEQLDRLLNQFG
jgi:hypothetical protein